MNILLCCKLKICKKDGCFPVAVQMLLIELCFKAHSHLASTSAFASSKITEANFYKKANTKNEFYAHSLCQCQHNLRHIVNIGRKR